MEFRILGPLEVAEGAPLALGSAQQRAVLALLVIHAGEPVTTDRLVDELWGERPPPTAVKTVQVYVSQLRKLLGAERVERAAAGYRLAADGEEIDARRFERRVAEGRDRLRDGDLQDAIAVWQAADSEWRGPALEGLDLPAATAEAARLEDLRVAAQEDRIDAELALGRHAELAAELATLSRAHPLRERLVAQQMLALYRSGRQAEALSAYRDARERLVAELGLEPGPELRDLERRILAQDPSLAAPPRVLAPPQRRRRRLLGAAGAALAAGVVAVALAGGDEALIPAGPNTAVAVDPESLEIVHRARVGDAPSAVAVSAGGAWVVNGNDETVSFIEAARGDVARTVVTRGTPVDVVAGAGAVWVVNRPGTLVRLDPQRAQATQRVRLPLPRRFGTRAPPPRLWAATVDDEVWVADGRWVWRLRTGRGASVRRAPAPLPGPIAVATSAWVGGLAQLDRRTLAERRRFGLPVGVEDLAVGAGAVWIADRARSSVVRVDPRSGRITHTARVGGFVTGVAVGEGAVWASLRSGELVRLDRRNAAVTGRVAVGGSPRAVATGEGLVWVASG